MDDASTLPGLVPVIGGQLRYQLTLLMPADHLLRRFRRLVRAAALAEHADELLAGPADDRRGDPGARDGHRPARAFAARARPGRAGRLGGGLPAALGALLPVGSDPAAARAGRREGVS